MRAGRGIPRADGSEGMGLSRAARVLWGVAMPAAVTLALPPGAADAAAQAPTNPYTQAVSASRSATDLVRSGELERATGLLEGVLDGCEADPDVAGDCRRVALYTLGWAHQLAAEERPAEREELLRRAAGYFQDVLDANPDYDAARRGLAQAYRKIGAREWQENGLRELAEGDRSGRYQVVLGDYYREHGRWRDAADAYRRAMELAPSDPAPRHRLLALYRAYDELPGEELAPLLPEWEVRFPGLAAEGNRILMRRRYPTDPEHAAEALARWLWAKDELDQVAPALAVEIPENWNAAPFASLRAFILDPLEAELAPWWHQNVRRRDVAASAALSLGRWRLADGEPDAAEEIWRRGRDLAPEGWASWIDLTAELALLYDQVPELDPDGAKFESLEFQLFMEKGRAIQRRDYESMLRFHGTLGRIYVRREEWGPDRGARNAVFQLEHAIEAAGGLEAETGFHHPLPEIRRLFGEALLQAGFEDDARALFAEAALAHLEVDDLEGAGELLERARGPGATTRARMMADAVERLLDLQRRVAAALGPEGPGACEAGILNAARELEGGPRIDEDHVARLRFRVLADCAAGAGDAAPELAAEALEELLGARTGLVGIADLTRVEDARSRVFAGFGQEVGPVDVARSVPGPGDGVIPLALPGDAGGVYLEVGPDALIAARLVRVLKPSAAPLELRLLDGRVTVLNPGPRGEEALEAVRAIDGVSGVRLRPMGG